MKKISIKELSKKGYTIFFCCCEEICEKFLKAAEEEGFIYPDGKKPTEKGLWITYVARNGNILSPLSMTAWYHGFSAKQTAGGVDIIRIDYAKLINGEDDYICKSPRCNYIVEKRKSL